MSESNVQQDVQVTEHDVQAFFSSQATLIRGAFSKLNVIDQKIKRSQNKLKKLHQIIQSKVEAKKDSHGIDVLKINLGIVKISVQAKKEQSTLKRLNIMRKVMSEKVDALVTSLDHLKNVSEQKGITLS